MNIDHAYTKELFINLKLRKGKSGGLVYDMM